MVAGRRAERRDLTHIFDSSDQSSYIRSDPLLSVKTVSYLTRVSQHHDDESLMCDD